MIKSLLLALTILSMSTPLWASCDHIMEEITNEEAPTTTFLALLQNMIEKKYISFDQYQVFLESVKSGKPRTPWKMNEESSNSSKLLFEKIFSDYINYWIIHPDFLEKETILNIGKENLQKWGGEAVKRIETNNETISPFVKMKSIKIPAGKLTLDNGARELVLSHDLEVQKYLVTQYNWSELMGENPSLFASGPDELTININGKDIIMQPDHPVEYVSWFSALVYANKLSEKEGYKPVYDFIKIKKNKIKTGGNPEKGNFFIFGVEIKINDTDGYRLPTLAEAEYIARGGTTTIYSYGNDGPLDAYGWNMINSDGQTHDVGQKLPNPFGIYDVHGNVRVWTEDPGPSPGTRMAQGGAYGSWGGHGNSAQNWLFGESQKHNEVGIRLVRTIQNKPSHPPKSFWKNLFRNSK